MTGEKEKKLENRLMDMLHDGLLVNNELFFIEVARMLSGGQRVTLRIKGNSMFPFMADGRDCVVLQQAKTISAGDVVLAFIPPRTYVLHRVYKLSGDRLLLMGDGNLHDVEICHRDDVVGKVVGIIRAGRYVDAAAAAERWRAWMWRHLLPVRRYLLFVCRRWAELKSAKQ